MQQCKRQQLIDAEIRTAFGSVLHESDLNTARVHYANAQRMIRGGDFPNAAKEAVCSVEACLSTITGEDDLKKALRKATQAGLPRPLDGVIKKLYAWRGERAGRRTRGQRAARRDESGRTVRAEHGRSGEPLPPRAPSRRRRRLVSGLASVLAEKCKAPAA